MQDGALKDEYVWRHCSPSSSVCAMGLDIRRRFQQTFRVSEAIVSRVRRRDKVLDSVHGMNSDPMPTDTGVSESGNAARLQPLTSALLDSQSPQAVVDAVVERGVDALGARAGVVALVSVDGAYLELMGSSGYPDEVLDGWSRFPIDSRLPLSDAVRENTVLLFTGRDDWKARYPEMVARVPAGIFQAAASLPLRARGQVFGGLHFSFPDERQFTPADIDYLADLSRLCALALDRALLLERTQQTLEQAERARDEAHAASRRLEFLARAGNLLGESLDYRMRMEALARLCVPELADWAAVDVVGESGDLLRLAVVHNIPERESAMREAQRLYPPSRDKGPNALTVIDTGQPFFYPVIPAELLDSGVLDEDQLRLVKLIGIKSILCVPIQARGRTLGALTLGMAPPPEGAGREFTPELRSLAEEIA